MRLRGCGLNLNRPRRVIIGRVYEKFKPIFEWRHENDHDSLLIYLPGFQKEFIKVTTEDANILRIRGERLVAGNKWDRFHEDFIVPKTCKKSRISAQLDGGILTVTMPKKITKSGEPMKTIDSAKPTSLTLNATLPSQPPAPAPISDGTKANDHGKTKQKPSDRNKEKEPLIDQKIRKTQTGSNSKMKDKLEGHMRIVKRLAMGGTKVGRMVVVLVAVAVLVAAALGVYQFMFRTSLKPQVKGIN